MLSTKDSSSTAAASKDTGSLTTYKELCALATDLGQPDLIYRFMDLAHHQQVGGEGWCMWAVSRSGVWALGF